MKSNIVRIVLTSTILSMSAATFAHADEAKNPYEDNLLGNWGGLRDQLAAKGVETTLEYRGDLWSVRSGGLKKGENYNDHIDLRFEMDNEKLLGINGNKAVIHVMNDTGGHVNNRIGSVQGIDNYDAVNNSFRLYEAYFDQSIMNDKLAFLFGLHDINTEFDVTDMSGTFIAPTMQIGQAFAQSGQNGPSIFPYTSVGGRLKANTSDDTYVMVGAFDGVSGNPDRPHGTHIDFESGDGLLLLAELGLIPNQKDQGDSINNKLAIGGWSYTEKMDDMRDVDSAGNPLQRRQQGVYLASSYQFYKDKPSERDLGAFFRIGVADGDTAQVDWDVETGLVGHGFIPHRADGEIGLGISIAHNADKYIDVTPGADSSERIVELYYKDKVAKGITVQPDFQYVINPGSDPAVDNATVVGMRFNIAF